MGILSRAHADEEGQLTGWPPHLYKYRALRTLLDVERAERVLDGYIYAAHRSQFNDPYDCAPSVEVHATREEMERHARGVIARTSGEGRKQRRRLAKGARSRLNQIGAKSLAERAVNDTCESAGIISLSAKPDDLLMWGHYGSEHTGVCFRFQLGPDSDFRAALPVGYSQDRPALVYPIKDRERLLDQAFLTKAKCWEYEQEWRIIAQQGAGEKAFRAEALDGLIFGARASADHIERLSARATRRAGPPITLYRARLDNRAYAVQLEAL